MVGKDWGFELGLVKLGVWEIFREALGLGRIWVRFEVYAYGRKGFRGPFSGNKGYRGLIGDCLEFLLEFGVRRRVYWGFIGGK